MTGGRGGGWGATGMDIGVGIEGGARDEVCGVVGVGVGAGPILGGSDVAGCNEGVGAGCAIDGPTFVVMATATVIGVAACVAPVLGVAGETSTRRAVFTGASSGGSDLGSGLSP